MIPWPLITIGLIVLIILTLYSSLAQDEGAVVTIPLSLVCFVAVLYAVIKAPGGWTVAALVVAAILAAVTLSNATYGMPRPGGKR